MDRHWDGLKLNSFSGDKNLVSLRRGHNIWKRLKLKEKAVSIWIKTFQLWDNVAENSLSSTHTCSDILLKFAHLCMRFANFVWYKSGLFSFQFPGLSKPQEWSSVPCATKAKRNCVCVACFAMSCNVTQRQLHDGNDDGYDEISACFALFQTPLCDTVTLLQAFSTAMPCFSAFSVQAISIHA